VKRRKKLSPTYFALEKTGNSRLAIKMFEIARKLDGKTRRDSPLDII